MASTLCQKKKKKKKKHLGFLSKSSNFENIGPHDFLHISPACSPNTYVWRDFRLSVLAFGMVARKKIKGKFTAKIEFPFGYFRLPLLTLTLKV